MNPAEALASLTAREVLAQAHPSLADEGAHPIVAAQEQNTAAHYLAAVRSLVAGRVSDSPAPVVPEVLALGAGAPASVPDAANREDEG